MKFRKWLTQNFLPMWAKETVLADNKRLAAENAALQLQNRELKAYIDGMQAGLRSMKRITIQTKGGNE